MGHRVQGRSATNWFQSARTRGTPAPTRPPRSGAGPPQAWRRNTPVSSDRGHAHQRRQHDDTDCGKKEKKKKRKKEKNRTKAPINPLLKSTQKISPPPLTRHRRTIGRSRLDTSTSGAPSSGGVAMMRGVVASWGTGGRVVAVSAERWFTPTTTYNSPATGTKRTPAS